MQASRSSGQPTKAGTRQSPPRRFAAASPPPKIHRPATSTESFLHKASTFVEKQPVLSTTSRATAGAQAPKQPPSQVPGPKPGFRVQI